MITLVLSVNGKRKWQSAIGADSWLHADVSLRTIKRPAHKGDLYLRLGGVDCRTDEFVVWRTPKIKIGDTITVEIVESRVADTPTSRRKIPKAMLEKYPKSKRKA